MTEAHFDYANCAAEIAEKEAAELRLQLRVMEENICRMMELGVRRERSLIPLYRRLLKFRQIQQHELDHALSCLAEDAVSLRKVVENFRAKWGRPPTRRDGKPIGINEGESP